MTTDSLRVSDIIDRARLHQLAQDLAISPAAVTDICRAYQITEEELEELSNNKDFITAYHAVQTKVQSDDAIAPQLKAREALLLSIPAMLAMITDKETMNMDKIAAVKVLATVAGATQKEKSQGGVNLGVQVNLHLPGMAVQSVNPTPVIDAEDGR